MVGLYAIKYFSTRCASHHCLSDTHVAYYARPPRLTYAPTEFNQELLEARALPLCLLRHRYCAACCIRFYPALRISPMFAVPRAYRC